MNGKTLSRLKEAFEGKVCSIFTKPICKTFTDRIWREHYAVRVIEVSVDGVWTEHPYTYTKSFFFAEQIVFIQEEVELDPNNPQHAQMIKEFEKETGEKVFSDVSPHLAPEIDRGETDITEVSEPGVLPAFAEKEKTPEVKEEQESVFVDIESLDALAKFTKDKETMMENVPTLPGAMPGKTKPELVQIN